jgi:hypothetical protein
MLRAQPGGRKRRPRHAAPLSPSRPASGCRATPSLFFGNNTIDQIVRASGRGLCHANEVRTRYAQLTIVPGENLFGKWSVLRLSTRCACPNLLLVVAGVVMPDRTELGGDRATLVKPTAPTTRPTDREIPVDMKGARRCPPNS